MAYQFYVKRFDKAFKEIQKIKLTEWNKVFQEVNDLKSVKIASTEYAGEMSNSYQIMQYWSQSEGGWSNLLFFDSKDGYACTARIDDFDEAIIKLREVASFLEAFIYGDEGEVYFIPNFGNVSGDISISDLKHGFEEFGDDWNSIYFKYRNTKR